MILEILMPQSLLRNRHRAKPCVEREALISRRTSELLPGDQNCPAARAKFLVRGRRQAILQQAPQGHKSKITTEVAAVGLAYGRVGTRPACCQEGHMPQPKACTGWPDPRGSTSFGRS